MPGWFIHFEALRQGINSIQANKGAQKWFSQSQNGPTAKEIYEIATKNPQYAAFGSIAPDMFVLLPDFKLPMGKFLANVIPVVLEYYKKWNDTFIEPFDKWMEKYDASGTMILNALIPGYKELEEIFSLAVSLQKDFIAALLVSQFDFFGLLGSGVTSGYDEKTFFWSDMIHYRRTFEFARQLWKNANGENGFVASEAHKAFALGWMSHVAADAAGHCFVNQKTGGPYRLHGQRHHLVENHMDSLVYRTAMEKNPHPKNHNLYRSFSGSAQHLWISFDDRHNANLFDPASRPQYEPGYNANAINDRSEKWGVSQWRDDQDQTKDDLIKFLSNSISKFYKSQVSISDPVNDTSHPTIMVDTVSTVSDGCPSASQIENICDILYTYFKIVSTEYYSTLRMPEPPKVFPIPDFPPPPGTSNDSPPTSSDKSIWDQIYEALIAIFSYVKYVAQVLTWGFATLNAVVLGPVTYPAREWIYNYLEVPLYNAWQAIHWLLCMFGYLTPMNSEICDGLVTMGLGTPDAWQETLNALNNPLSAMQVQNPQGWNEPSRSADASIYPKDMVQDANSTITNTLNTLLDDINKILGTNILDTPCKQTPRPSEFERPWKWPYENNDGTTVPQELQGTLASPFRVTQDANILVDLQFEGNNGYRTAVENAMTPQETDQINTLNLPKNRHLGSCADYTAYVIAWLTRKNTGTSKLPNFNLDCDRGYSYKCWDYERQTDVQLAAPKILNLSNMTYEHWRRPPYKLDHKYFAPLRPGTGWCIEDMLSYPNVPSSPGAPKMHQSSDIVKTKYLP